MPVDRTQFKPDPKPGRLVGSIALDNRTADISLRSTTGNYEAAWANLERVVVCLRDQMPLIGSAVRDLFSRLGDPSEETAAGGREIERMLSRLASSDMSCIVYADSARVLFDAPRLTDHCIEVEFGAEGKILSATIAS